MKKITLILMLILLLGVLAISSCGTTKIITEQITVVDTVLITETLRDTLLKVTADSSMIQALVECDSLGQARLKQIIEHRNGLRVGPPSLSIENNILTAMAEVDSIDIYMKLKDRHTVSKSVEKELMTERIEVNVLTRWQKWMVTLGNISLGVIVLGLGFLIFKKVKI